MWQPEDKDLKALGRKHSLSPGQVGRQGGGKAVQKVLRLGGGGMVPDETVKTKDTGTKTNVFGVTLPPASYVQ